MLSCAALRANEFSFGPVADATGKGCIALRAKNVKDVNLRKWEFLQPPNFGQSSINFGFELGVWTSDL